MTTFHTASHLPFGPLKAAALGAVNLTRSYDQRYNVARIKAGSFDYTYSRAAAGHVTGIAGIQTPTTSGEAINYSYNPANNQLTGAAPKSYSYDVNGNMISDGTSTFTYDGLNRLVKVEKAGATVATYGYDSSNRRIRKTVGAVTTHYLYDLNNQLIAETLVDGTVLREYIYLDGEPLALKEYQTNPGTYYFINDHLATPQQLVTASGAIVWQAAYLPFGQAQIKTATVKNNLRFPGQYFDAETGLHYNWNRYYDPELGRYISVDPIGMDGWMNLYTYVGGNPVNAVDPRGLWFGGDFIDGVGYYYDNYKKMKRGNITGSDKYYHCMANCQASKRGAGGKLAALDIDIARELTDFPRNIAEKGLTPKDAYEDLVEDSQANSLGFTCPEPVPCHDRCKGLVPATSLPFIFKNMQP